MKSLTLLAIILFSGCAMIPQDALSRARLAEAYPAAAPARERISVGGQAVILSSIGYGFPDDSLIVDVDRLVRQRKKDGVWRVEPELPTRSGTWSTTVVEDYVIFTHVAGIKPLFSTLFVSASGRIGIREADSPILDKLEPIARSIEASLSQRGSSTPLVIIPK